MVNPFDVFLLSSKTKLQSKIYKRGDKEAFNVRFCSRRVLYGLRQNVQYCQSSPEIIALGEKVFREEGRPGNNIKA